jgi:tetratricopeptide (TPR) repeat protein
MTQELLFLRKHRLKRLDESDKCFEKALQINPRNSEALIGKVNVLFKKGVYDEAVSFYDRSIDINPNNAMLHFNKGIALAACGHTDEAIASLEKAISIRPDFIDASLAIAKIRKEISN